MIQQPYCKQVSSHIPFHNKYRSMNSGGNKWKQKFANGRKHNFWTGNFRRKRSKKIKINKAASETGRSGGKIFRACDSSRRDDVPESWQITQLLGDVDMSCRVGKMQQPIYRSCDPRSVAKRAGGRRMKIVWSYLCSKEAVYVSRTHLRADEVGVPSRLCRPELAVADGIEASR